MALRLKKKKERKKKKKGNKENIQLNALSSETQYLLAQFTHKMII
jgi:hypothetical protein